jgi:hypothetical protein
MARAGEFAAGTAGSVQAIHRADTRGGGVEKSGGYHAPQEQQGMLRFMGTGVCGSVGRAGASGSL